jgi:hypothetical protein
MGKQDQQADKIDCSITTSRLKMQLWFCPSNSVIGGIMTLTIKYHHLGLDKDPQKINQNPFKF